MSKPVIALPNGNTKARRARLQALAAQLTDQEADIVTLYLESDAATREKVRTMLGMTAVELEVQPAGNLSPFFQQHPETTYKLCNLWGKANTKDTEAEWHYVAGWIAGTGDNLTTEAGEDLTFLHGIALCRSLMAWEVQQ